MYNKVFITIHILVFKILHPHPLPPPQAIEGDSNCGKGSTILLPVPIP